MTRIDRTDRTRPARRRGLRPSVALLAILGVAALSLAAARVTRPAAAAPQNAAPTERIDVEQAVDFPYDI